MFYAEVSHYGSPYRLLASMEVVVFQQRYKLMPAESVSIVAPVCVGESVCVNPKINTGKIIDLSLSLLFAID